MRYITCIRNILSQFTLQLKIEINDCSYKILVKAKQDNIDVEMLFQVGVCWNNKGLIVRRKRHKETSPAVGAIDTVSQAPIDIVQEN